VDQSHPNLFHFRYLSKEFPEARFVGLIRDPYSVVYSMLHHSGVLKWIHNWHLYPVPNEFLGIRYGEEQFYARLTLAERSALRWASHIEKMNDAAAELLHRICIIRYEDLCLSHEETKDKLARFLGVQNQFSIPDINFSSLTKKDALSKTDRRAIYHIIRSRLPTMLESRVSDALLNYLR
jgi:hypothetical protein